jgi:ABC-2 type transport system ATP-binding protein
VAGVDRDGDALDIAADGAQAAAINAALVGAGIAVSELVAHRASLEDVFLQITGEGVAA